MGGGGAERLSGEGQEGGADTRPLACLQERQNSQKGVEGRKTKSRECQDLLPNIQNQSRTSCEDSVNSEWPGISTAEHQRTEAKPDHSVGFT